MSIRIKNNTIFVEFSLSQPKRAWKIRSKTPRDGRGRFDHERKVYKFTPAYGDIIKEGDVFEWMVDNEEIRDILSALKCLSENTYGEIKKEVYAIKEFRHNIKKELGLGVEIEASLKPKQRKPSEQTPFFFVLFPMDKPTDVCYIINKRGEKIEHPTGHKIKAGDKLVWVVNEKWLKEVVVSLAKLDKAHKERIIKEVFEVIG